MKYSREKIKELTGIEIDADYGYIQVMDEKQYKSNQQSKLFHALLMCFWKSGCSSFESYEELRNHYKSVAHLLEYKFVNNLKPETKQILWKAVKLLPISIKERDKVIEILKGPVLIWHSWAECSKEMAEVTINQLLSDMFQAGVPGSSQNKKLEEIMEGINNGF